MLIDTILRSDYKKCSKAELISMENELRLLLRQSANISRADRIIFDNIQKIKDVLDPMIKDGKPSNMNNTSA